MPGNIITRREFNISRMGKEFPDIPLSRIEQAQWELEFEYPNTDWEEEVYYDTGKSVKKPGVPAYKNTIGKINEIKKEIKATPSSIKKQPTHRNPNCNINRKSKLQQDIQRNGFKRIDFR